MEHTMKKNEMLLKISNWTRIEIWDLKKSGTKRVDSDEHFFLLKCLAQEK